MRHVDDDEDDEDDDGAAIIAATMICERLPTYDYDYY